MKTLCNTEDQSTYTDSFAKFCFPIEQIPTLLLDDFTDEGEGYLIKLNVEKYELKVLLGVQNLLKFSNSSVLVQALEDSYLLNLITYFICIGVSVTFKV